MTASRIVIVVAARLVAARLVAARLVAAWVVLAVRVLVAARAVEAVRLSGRAEHESPSRHATPPLLVLAALPPLVALCLSPLAAASVTRESWRSGSPRGEPPR